MGTRGRGIVQIMIISLVICLFLLCIYSAWFYLRMKTCTLNLEWHIVEMHYSADFEG